MSDFAAVLARVMSELQTGGLDGSPHGCGYRASARGQAATSRPFEARRALESRPSWAAALGISVPCTERELRVAFRRLALRTHPDRPGGSHEAFLGARAALDQALAALSGQLCAPPGHRASTRTSRNDTSVPIGGDTAT